MAAYYNEIDPYAAQWLRNLIEAGHIAPGIVDERSIEDVRPSDLAGYTQCHFFAGIGVWSHALRAAGWADDVPVWTGSCPCQPFSSAGAGAGFEDARHLWPTFAWLIKQCKPTVVFGEQVASKAVEPWVDLVHADMEAMGYAFGAVPFPSAGVGAPHIRDRLFWVADSESNGYEWAREFGKSSGRNGSSHMRAAISLGHPSRSRLEERIGDTGMASGPAGACQGQTSERAGVYAGIEPADPVNGFWRDADWLGCRDGKWRPVEPGTFPLAHGAAARMVCVCPDCKTETVIYENMHSLRSIPLGNQGRGTEEVLRQGMLQAASLVAAAHKQKYGALPGESCGEKQDMQSMPSNLKPGSSPSGQECSERQPEQSGENLLDVSRRGAPQHSAFIDMRGVWGGLHRSLASEPKQDLLCPMCKRVGPQECNEEMGGARVGRLRGYGNAINAEAAMQFIAAYLES